MISKNEVAKFRKDVWSYYKKNGRNSLPWRTMTHPYRILVSEVMLQQTQVPRVIEKYKEFLKAFPTVKALASSSLSEVLKVWSGMGYNRRGKYLHDAARAIVERYGGDVPRDFMELRSLPGIGPYTASAVRVFAFNEPDILIETNIRAAAIHHFFPLSHTVSDRKLRTTLERAGKEQDPREWHSALMDYGTHLKKLHNNPTRRSAHYAVQTKFEGSLRQMRGAILKLLTDGSHGDLALAKKLSFEESRVRRALSGLKRDGLICSEKGSWRIA